jgi:hypothetical protein
MLSRRSLKPSYSAVTATLALFLALGGGAYAASVLPAKSVGARELKKNAVVRAKIKNNAVNGSKVAADSLTGQDIRESSLAQVPSAAAADNATHANGAAALDKVSYKSAGGAVAAGGVASATAGCEAGQHVIGGGVHVDDPVNTFIVDGYPDAANTAWTGRVGNTGGATSGFTVYAICTVVTTAG